MDLSLFYNGRLLDTQCARGTQSVTHTHTPPRHIAGETHTYCDPAALGVTLTLSIAMKQMEGQLSFPFFFM